MSVQRVGRHAEGHHGSGRRSPGVGFSVCKAAQSGTLWGLARDYRPLQSNAQFRFQHSIHPGDAVSYSPQPALKPHHIPHAGPSSDRLPPSHLLLLSSEPTMAEPISPPLSPPSRALSPTSPLSPRAPSSSLVVHHRRADHLPHQAHSTQLSSYPGNHRAHLPLRCSALPPGDEGLPPVPPLLPWPALHFHLLPSSSQVSLA